MLSVRTLTHRRVFIQLIECLFRAKLVILCHNGNLVQRYCFGWIFINFYENFQQKSERIFRSYYLLAVSFEILNLIVEFKLNLPTECPQNNLFNLVRSTRRAREVFVLTGGWIQIVVFSEFEFSIELLNSSKIYRARE